jgi:hypothetical protein
MTVERLISAYLDGDLTPEQDELLRTRISADPAAHEAFDAAVILHISMCYEDRTEVPLDLRKSVFGAIEASANQASAGRFRNIKSVASRKFGTMVVMLFLLCLPITDSFLELNSFRDSSIFFDVNQVSGAANSATNMKASIHGTGEGRESALGISRQAAGYAIDGDDELATLRAKNDNSTELNSNQSVEQPRIEQPTLNSLFSRPLPTASETEDRDGIYSSADLNNTTQRTRISLATMYGEGFGSNASGATNISQVAASIGYEMGKEDFVGLEFGATSYSIEYSTSSLLGAPDEASMASREPIDVAIQPQASTVQMPMEQPTKLTSPDPATTHYSASQFTTSSRQSTVWGTAFYERRFITLSSLSLNARAAAGVGEDGLIGYGRLIGEWRLGGVVSLVIGSELRTMPFRTGTRNNNQSGINYGTILTGLTGVHVRF